MTLSFPPPKNWQDFETLTKDIARFKLEGDFENYGRLGQAQGGIDIFGSDKKNQNTGLQCKHKKQAPPTSNKIVTDISIDTIERELKIADKFRPILKYFIIATTSFRDTKIQNHIFSINNKRKNKSLPLVTLWTWETFDEELNKHAELGYVYYENILKSSNHYDKDVHILSLLRHSLDRPAFNTFFQTENHCEHFVQAISDNLVASSFSSKKLSEKSDRDKIINAETILQEIRVFVTQQLKDGNIVQQNNFLEFRHNWELKISNNLNKKRREIIEIINKVLKKHGLEKINSPLLK